MNARHAVVVSVGIAASVVILARAAEDQHPTTAPAQNKWVKHYYDCVEKFRRENAAARNIVMVGDSLTEGFNASKWLPGRPVVNRGITSDGVGLKDRGVLHRLDESLFDCNPGFVILEIATNDLGDLWRGGKSTMDDIEACYRKVVRKIRDRLPGVPLVLVNSFPARDKYAGLVPHVREWNKRLERIGADFQCPVMDMYAPLAGDDGLLKSEYSRDGLHVNEAGYRIWAEKLEKVLPQGKP